MILAGEGGVAGGGSVIILAGGEGGCTRNIGGEGGQS